MMYAHSFKLGLPTYKFLCKYVVGQTDWLTDCDMQ